jgi:hypothetical protein
MKDTRKKIPGRLEDKPAFLKQSGPFGLVAELTRDKKAEQETFQRDQSIFQSRRSARWFRW